jgi:hypothetical protein
MVNRNANNYLEYRPDLRPPVRFRPLPDKAQIAEPSVSFAEEVETKGLEALSTVNGFYTDIESRLSSQQAFQEFVASRDVSCLKSEWESIEGSSDYDVLPLVLEIRDDVNEMRRILVEVQSNESINEDTRLKMLSAIDKSFEVSVGTVNECASLLRITGETVLGDVNDAKEEVLTGGVQTVLADLVEDKFDGLVQDQNLYWDRAEIFPREIKYDVYWETLNKGADLNLRVTPILSWAKSLNPSYGLTPGERVIGEVYDMLETIKNDLDALLVDLHKYNDRDRSSYDLYTDVARQKARARNLYSITKE